MPIFKGKKGKPQTDSRDADHLVAQATTAKRPDPNKLSAGKMR